MNEENTEKQSNVSGENNLQKAILSSAENALGKIQEIEDGYQSIPLEKHQETFHQLCEQLNTNTANQLLKQANKWTQEKLGEQGEFETTSLNQYAENIDFWIKNEEETHPYIQNQIDRIKNNTIAHQNQLSALKVMLNDMQNTPKESDSIVVPSLQFNISQKQKQMTEAQNERHREKLKECLKVEEQLQTKMQQYKIVSDQLKAAVAKMRKDYDVNSKDRRELEAKIHEMQDQIDKQTVHFKEMRQKEEQEYAELERKLAAEESRRKSEYEKRREERRKKKEEDLKRRLLNRKMCKGDTISIPPMPFDFESLKKKYDLLFNTEKVDPVEVVYTMQSCLDAKGQPKSELVRELLLFAGKTFSPAKSVRFNTKSDQSQQRVMSPSAPRQQPIIESDQQSQRCLTPNIGGNDVTYVFTEKYKTADGVEHDFGAMKPQSIKPCFGGFRVIFRDGNDGMIIDTKVKSSRENIVVLTAMTQPVRITNVFV